MHVVIMTNLTNAIFVQFNDEYIIVYHHNDVNYYGGLYIVSRQY